MKIIISFSSGSSDSSEEDDKEDVKQEKVDIKSEPLDNKNDADGQNRNSEEGGQIESDPKSPSFAHVKEDADRELMPPPSTPIQKPKIEPQVCLFVFASETPLSTKLQSLV